MNRGYQPAPDIMVACQQHDLMQMIGHDVKNFIAGIIIYFNITFDNSKIQKQ